MNFKAEVGKDGKLEVKPIIEKKGSDVTIHLPSLKLINSLTKEYGKRNIQQI